MRIIAGRFKKKNLVSIKSAENLRATSDFVRESIFDVLGDVVKNKNFLELFAGSGAVSFEALSRGAKKIFLVEKSIKNVNIIRRNISELKLNKDEYKIYCKDSFKFLKQNEIFFHIIFADPPYNKGLAQKTILELENFKFLEKENLIIIEYSKSEKLNIPKCFEIFKEKLYSDTKVIFLKKRN